LLLFRLLHFDTSDHLILYKEVSFETVVIQLQCMVTISALLSMMKLLTQDHLQELLQKWQNYERELEDCKNYVTNIAMPFIQSESNSIAGKEFCLQQNKAQVVITSFDISIGLYC